MEDRFWSKVDRRDIDECWPWLAAKDQHGRGQFWARGKLMRAPRIAWELANGAEFPEGMDACHSCDNPNCVNPSHIWPGTARDNAIDAHRKGRVRTPWELGIVPHNKLKTHCKRGHPFDSKNTCKLRNGRRQCRACMDMLRSESERRIAAIDAARAAERGKE